MRSLLLLAAVCCLVLSACGGPIARPEGEHAQGSRALAGKQQARQAAPAAPAASDDDDDEDDDDDDVDLGLEDDDDEEEDEDDEEEADDDDDDDYLERFFEDILGEDEDEDDDEPAAAQPVVAPADTVAAAPAAPAAAASEEVAAASEEVAEVAESEAAASEAEEPAAGQKEPASAEVESAAAASSDAAAAATEDDEEEDDDIADALDPEDDEDDEDDDEEEDDDDDDDDDITDALGRNHSAKHARALAEEPKAKPPVPAVYIVKYNRFVDNILEKMNDVLRRSYDPVSVKLQPIDASKKASKPKKNKKKSNKRKTSHKKNNTARAGDADKNKEAIPTTTIPDPANKIEENKVMNEEKPNTVAEQVQNEPTEPRALKEKESSKAKPTTTKPKAPTKATKPKPKPPTKSTTKKPVTTKNKVKTTNEKSKPRAKGTLYGLSSLRRTGDVVVSIQTDHTTIKSNFAVGPLILRVEKEVGRGAKKEIKSATATTAEMTGKITLRVNDQGIATLHTIKVLQPKQVRVDSNHERTRELVWRRSARIAHVVSEKLLSASKPMFHQHIDTQ